MFSYFHKLLEIKNCKVVLKRIKASDILLNGKESQYEQFVKEMRVKKASLRQTTIEKSVMEQFRVPHIKLKKVMLTLLRIKYLVLSIYFSSGS